MKRRDTAMRIWARSGKGLKVSVLGLEWSCLGIARIVVRGQKLRCLVSTAHTAGTSMECTLCMKDSKAGSDEFRRSMMSSSCNGSSTACDDITKNLHERAYVRPAMSTSSRQRRNVVNLWILYIILQVYFYCISTLYIRGCVCM